MCCRFLPFHTVRASDHCCLHTVLQKCLLTEKRHLEVELSSSRNALIRVMQHPGPIQQQLQQQGPCAAGDECAVLSFHQQSCLLGTLQEQDAALQETQQQVAYEQALTGHLYCVLEQVRASAEAAASDDSSTSGLPAVRLLDRVDDMLAPVHGGGPMQDNY